MRYLASLLIILMASLSLSAGITVLNNTGGNILLEYRLDPYQVIEENGFDTILIDGYEFDSAAGAPLIPRLDTKIGLPPGGNLNWSIQVLEEEQVRLANRLAPVPTMRMAGEMSRADFVINESLYAGLNQDYVSAFPQDNFRGYLYAPISIRPFRYDGAQRLTLLKHGLISISIDGQLNFRGGLETDELSSLMLDNFVNSAQAKNWKNHTRNSINYAPFAASDYWLRIETEKDGIHRLNYSQLNALPLADIDPRTFRLFSTGGEVLPFLVNTAGPAFKEIAIHVSGEEDGHFDSGDYILFFGRNRDGIEKTQALGGVPTAFNPHSQNGVYWLTFGGEFSGTPLRMDTLPELSSWTDTANTQKKQARLETETHRRLQWGFGWFMTKLFGVATADYTFNIPLVNPDTTKNMHLSLRLQQEDVDVTINHRINVSVNGTSIPPPAGYNGFAWAGTVEYILSRNSAAFTNGDNEIRLTVYREGSDNLFLDFITVDYTQKLTRNQGQYFIDQPSLSGSRNIRYEVAGTLGNAEVYRMDSFDQFSRIPAFQEEDYYWFVAPGNGSSKFVITSPSEYYSPSRIKSMQPVNLISDTSLSDHVIITATEFLTSAQNLADMYHQFYGLSVRVVDQQDILNQFNGGHPDPVALRQYLRWVYFQGNGRLKGLTLIGLGTFDWRNTSRQSAPKNKVMVYQRGLTTSDDFFAMINSSYYPELIVGRYPVRNATELNNMLSNYRNYVENPSSGWWRNSMVFLGDDLYNGSQTYYENYHTRQVQESAVSIHPSIQVDKIFGWEYDYDEYQNKPGARDDMIAMINEGRLVWYYIGHGNFDSLGSEDYFNGASDIGRFANPDHLPLFMAASCKISQFDHWGFESLGQKTVLLNNLGAIASLSATRMSGPTSNVGLMKKILNNMINNRNYLGASIMAGKIASNTDDNDHFYVLLGDPTLRVIPPERDSLMSMSVDDAKASLRSRQKVNIQGSLRPYMGDGKAEIKVFDSERYYYLDPETYVSHGGKTLFRGSSTVSGGAYSASFIVPDDITNGNTGSIVSYLWDASTKQDYTNYYYPLSTSNNAVPLENHASPKIELYLGNFDFRAGDEVPTKTTLLARISDDNGINLTGSPGHQILLVLDNSIQPISVTQYFDYDQDSYTSGTLRYPLSNLKEGPHTVQVIAFDNLNLPSVASTDFIAKKTGELSIERLLIYPNPIQTDAHITFLLSKDCELDIGIYSISGKRLRRIKTTGREGFNKIYWDGRDNKSNRLANNTYFVKINAKSGSLKAEARERLVIYK